MERSKYMRTAADVVMNAHMAWVGLVITALPLVLVRPRSRHFALGVVGTTVGSWVVFNDCPLFLLENRLRRSYDPCEAYEGSFLSHYLEKFFAVRIPSAFFTVAGYVYGALVVAASFSPQLPPSVGTHGPGTEVIPHE